MVDGLPFSGLPMIYVLHAALMLLAWGILMPAGALIARFFKVTRGQDFPRELDNQFWWRWHRRLQYFAVALLTLALWLIWVPGQWPASAHGRMGLALSGLAWLQVVSALLRGSKGGPTDRQMRGDHYDMSLRRRLFEFWHKSLGWVVLLLVVVVIAGGLRQAGLGTLWVVGLPLALFLLHLAFFVLFTVQGRHVDTYTAIWGRPLPRKPRMPDLSEKTP